MSMYNSYVPYFVAAYLHAYSIQEKGYPCLLYIHDKGVLLPYISGSYISHNLRDPGDVLGVVDAEGRLTRTLRKPFSCAVLTAVLESLGFTIDTSSNHPHKCTHTVWYRNRYLGRIYG